MAGSDVAGVATSSVAASSMPRPSANPSARERAPITRALPLDRLLSRALIAEVYDPRAEPPRLNELELDPLVQRGEVRGSGAEDDRADEEAVLVDQVVRHQRRGQTGAADGEVFARLLLELRHHLRRVVLHQRCVALALIH